MRGKGELILCLFHCITALLHFALNIYGYLSENTDLLVESVSIVHMLLIL